MKAACIAVTHGPTHHGSFEACRCHAAQQQAACLQLPPVSPRLAALWVAARRRGWTGVGAGVHKCTRSNQAHPSHAHPCAVQDPRDQAPVIVAGKDQGEVDNDYFLVG